MRFTGRLRTERLYLFGVKGNVCCDALVVGGLGVGPLVAPIELVQLRIRVLKLKSQLIACADVAIPCVTHLGCERRRKNPINSPVWELDKIGPVFGLRGINVLEAVRFRCGLSSDS
jgi:hypothetical protein